MINLTHDMLKAKQPVEGRKAARPLWALAVQPYQLALQVRCTGM